MPKTDNELVSIIIPAYNCAEYIEETVASALASTYPHIEIIITNDGSIDSTAEVIEQIVSKHPEIKAFHQKNQGVSATRNYCISQSSGKYILPLDADDLISADYIEKAVGVLSKEENVKVVYGKAGFIGDRTGDWNLPEFNIHLLARKNLIYVSALFRKADFDKTAGFCTEMPSLEDWDIWISLLKNGAEVVCLSEKCFYYRVHKKSSRIATRNLKKKMIDILNSHHESFFYRELGGKLHYQRTWSKTLNWLNRLAQKATFKSR
ncbi:MAG: glycosyltransferase family A protein [Paludibacter sp.]|jgi:glycosyltransferase involved in cell wall biosynthesis